MATHSGTGVHRKLMALAARKMLDQGYRQLDLGANRKLSVLSCRLHPAII
jgi:hypothetical protein